MAVDISDVDVEEVKSVSSLQGCRQDFVSFVGILLFTELNSGILIAYLC